MDISQFLRVQYTVNYKIPIYFRTLRNKSSYFLYIIAALKNKLLSVCVRRYRFGNNCLIGSCFRNIFRTAAGQNKHKNEHHCLF